MPVSLLDFLVGGIAQAGFGTLAVYFLVATQPTIFSVTLYLHRSMAHRAVDFHPALAHVFRFWTWLTTSMITREWAAMKALLAIRFQALQAFSTRMKGYALAPARA